MANPLSRLYESTWEENILFSALVELTYKCNLDCSFCYNDLGLQGEPLRTEQYLEFFDDLAELGVMNLSLSGGEPLAHPDFFLLGSRARELGFVVRVKSNGHALRGDLARKLRTEVDPFVVEVSLHGASPRTHDRQTRVPGSYERLLANLREMKSLGLRLKLNATLTLWNETELEAMFELADQLEIPLTFDPMVTPRDNGDRAPLEISASAKARRRLYEVMQGRGMLPTVESPGSEADSATRKNCGAGAASITVDPYGSVFPCVQWRRPLGNLHDGSIDEIWQTSPQLAEVRAINEAAGEQGLALAREGLRVYHCMGLSELATGDPLAVDPRSRENAELTREAQRPQGRALLPIVE